MKFTAVVENPLHNTCVVILGVTVGVGLITKENPCGTPPHVLESGVTIMEAVIGTGLVLVAVNVTLPEPVEPIPMVLSLLVHE